MEYESLIDLVGRLSALTCLSWYRRFPTAGQQSCCSFRAGWRRERTFPCAAASTRSRIAPARRLSAGGARLDAVYFCPHHPTAGHPPYRRDCDCRKPRPGLLRRAEKELGADLRRSWVVGDRHGDLQLAWNVGARGAIVKSGYGLGELTYLAPGWARPPDLVAENLLEAVERILGPELE